MAGLSLGVGGYGSAGASLPTAANPPSSTISQAAFGIGTSQTGNSGPRTAGYGTVSLGVLGAIVLTWLWYTLPR
jgi:hypothetical protein